MPGLYSGGRWARRPRFQKNAQLAHFAEMEVVNRERNGQREQPGLTKGGFIAYKLKRAPETQDKSAGRTVGFSDFYLIRLQSGYWLAKLPLNMCLVLFEQYSL